MRVAVVFESLFGNTEVLAHAVALGLADRGAEVVTLRAGDRDDHLLTGFDLLVLAAPTHALSLSSAATRADAVARGADEVDATTGLREWLAGAATIDAADRPPVAVFDTRARIARHWPGSAARSAARLLRQMGFTVVRRTSFYVREVKGPVVEGEVERAREWGRSIAGSARGRAATGDAGT